MYDMMYDMITIKLPTPTPTISSDVVKTVPTQWKPEEMLLYICLSVCLFVKWQHRSSNISRCSSYGVYVALRQAAWHPNTTFNRPLLGAGGSFHLKPSGPYTTNSTKIRRQQSLCTMHSIGPSTENVQRPRVHTVQRADQMLSIDDVSVPSLQL